jgi:tetratricopeptide (TPR) repeat protein
LIELLLRIHADTQAQSELIALAENVGDDPTQQARIGSLFLRANDYEHALTAYRASLHGNRRNAAGLAGAGYAAFELGQYPIAVRYLEAATAADPNDAQSVDRLKTAQMVLRLDPFRRDVSVSERNRIVIEGFAIAGQRLNGCALPKITDANSSGTQPLSDDWNRVKPQITEAGLRRNPDLVEQAMDLVFRIERETSNVCEPPTGTDLALLLISKLHEGI